MAKETAHQFGTPLSSLSGWLMMMQEYAKVGDTEAIAKTITDMDADVKRLQLAANRFGKVGSNIKLKVSHLDALISPTVEYIRRRLPQRSNAVQLVVEHANPHVEVKVDPDLFSWALENVIKNSMDALKNNAGLITIKTFQRKKIFTSRLAIPAVEWPNRNSGIFSSRGSHPKNGDGAWV